MSNPNLLTISTMTEADLASVVALEQLNPGPWNEKQLRDELTQSSGWQWLAKDLDGSVCGYLLGRTITDEAEILRLAVATNKRRLGVAQLLLDHAFADLARNSVTTCFLELRASNAIARALYEKNGFRANGIRKNYYHDPCEDAVVMIRLLQPEEPSIEEH